MTDGCIPSETLSPCKHGRLEKFGCLFCRLEKFHDEWHKMPKYDLKECIDLVNQHEEYLKKIDKIALCDPDKVISNQKMLQERMNKLDEFHEEFKDVLKDDIDKHHKTLTDMNERIEKLEELNQQCFDANPIAEIEKRFEKLDKELKELRRFQDISHLEYQQRNKRPYKCPACEGTTKYHEIVLDGVLFKNVIPCLSCDRGIVWG